MSPSSWMESVLGCRAGKGYSWGVMSDWSELGPGSLLVTLEELLRDLRNWYRLFKLIGGWFVNPNLYTYSGTSVHLRTHSSYLSWLQTYPVSGAWWCWSWESANHTPAGSLTARLCQDGTVMLQDGEGRGPTCHLLPVCLRPWAPHSSAPSPQQQRLRPRTAFLTPLDPARSVPHRDHSISRAVPAPLGFHTAIILTSFPIIQLQRW